MAEAFAHHDPRASETLQEPSTKKAAPEAGPISAAISASAEGLAPRKRDLETALTDASLFGRLAYHAFCDIGFDRYDPPPLDRNESTLVYWTMSRLSWMVDEAKTAFYEEHEKKRGLT